MKKFLLIYALAASVAAWWGIRHYRAENERLACNQAALLSDVDHYRTRLGREAASVEVLRLRCAEFRKLREADAAQIRRLGIRLRRLESAAKTVTRSEAALSAPLRDTVVVRLRDTVWLRDTVRFFRWQDAWVEVEGAVGADSVWCRVASTDTLRQVVHRVPRRFLFIRWGTKAIRQEIRSSNPHTRIVYSESVRIER